MTAEPLDVRAVVLFSVGDHEVRSEHEDRLQVRSLGPAEPGDGRHRRGRDGAELGHANDFAFQAERKERLG